MRVLSWCGCHLGSCDLLLSVSCLHILRLPIQGYFLLFVVIEQNPFLLINKSLQTRLANQFFRIKPWIHRLVNSPDITSFLWGWHTLVRAIHANEVEHSLLDFLFAAALFLQVYAFFHQPFFNCVSNAELEALVAKKMWLWQFTPIFTAELLFDCHELLLDDEVGVVFVFAFTFFLYFFDGFWPAKDRFVNVFVCRLLESLLAFESVGASKKVKQLCKLVTCVHNVPLLL